MAVAGKAVLAIWNTIAPELHESEYDAWITREHLRERVDIPGFVRARRYTSLDTGHPAYFACYELANDQVLTEAPYQARVASPTPWTQQMKPHLRTSARGTFGVLATTGDGIGGALATLRLRIPREIDARQGVSLCDTIMREPRMMGVHCAVERHAEPNHDDTVGHLLMLESARATALEACVAAACRAIESVASRVREPQVDLFALSCVIG